MADACSLFLQCSLVTVVEITVEITTPVLGTCCGLLFMSIVFIYFRFHLQRVNMLFDFRVYAVACHIKKISKMWCNTDVKYQFHKICNHTQKFHFLIVLVILTKRISKADWDEKTALTSSVKRSKFSIYWLFDPSNSSNITSNFLLTGWAEIVVS